MVYLIQSDSFKDIKGLSAFGVFEALVYLIWASIYVYKYIFSDGQRAAAPIDRHPAECLGGYLNIISLFIYKVKTNTQIHYLARTYWNQRIFRWCIWFGLVYLSRKSLKLNGIKYTGPLKVGAHLANTWKKSNVFNGLKFGINEQVWTSGVFDVEVVEIKGFYFWNWFSPVCPERIGPPTATATRSTF